MPLLVLYSRPECHLCEEMSAELGPLLADRATLTIVDVDQDPKLSRRYGPRIPVLVAGDTEISAYPLDRERVTRWLDSL